MSTLTSLQREISALIQLLDDPETSVQEAVRKRLTEIGEAAVPQLDAFRVSTSDGALKQNAEQIIRAVTIDSFQDEVAILAGEGIHTMEELEDAVFLFSRFLNPTLRIRPYSELLDKMADEAVSALRKAESSEAQMLAFIHFLFTEKGYKGCKNDYLNPRHSYLHTVLTGKEGIPLTLAFVLLFTARRLNLPFYGLNIPLHFLVKYVTPSNESIIIDPFNQGSILTREQCDNFLVKNGIRKFSEYYQTATPYSMFTRFVRNLINGHAESGEARSAKLLQQYLMMIEAANSDRRI